MTVTPHSQGSVSADARHLLTSLEQLGRVRNSAAGLPRLQQLKRRELPRPLRGRRTMRSESVLARLGTAVSTALLLRPTRAKRRAFPPVLFPSRYNNPLH